MNIKNGDFKLGQVVEFTKTVRVPYKGLPMEMYLYPGTRGHVILPPTPHQGMMVVDIEDFYPVSVFADQVMALDEFVEVRMVGEDEIEAE